MGARAGRADRAPEREQAVHRGRADWRLRTVARRGCHDGGATWRAGTDTTELQRTGHWRFDQLDDLPDDGRRYEVVDGLLVVSPPPTFWHQAVSAALLRQLSAQAPPDWFVLPELGLPLGSDGRVPDLSVVSARAPLQPGAPLPGPEHLGLVVEVVSPSSRRTDRFAKPGEYADAGIPLCWRVETEPDLLVVAHALRDGAYERVATVDGAGAAPAPWGPVRLDLGSIRDLSR